MLKEKTGERSGGRDLKGKTKRGDTTKLLFDMASFDFSLKNLPDSIKKTKKLILKYTGASGCTIMFIDSYGHLWKIGEETTYPFRLGEGVAGWAAKCRKTVFIDDILKDKRYKALYATKSGAIVSIPVLKGGRCVGVINLTYPEEALGNYPPNKKILEIFAKKMRTVMENVFLYYIAEGERNELKARKKIMGILSEDMSFNEKVDAIRKEISGLINIDNLSICVKDDEGRALICYGRNDRRKKKLSLDLLALYINREGKKHAFVDLSEKLNFEYILTRGVGYITMYPIFSGGKITGYILIEDEIKNIDNLSIIEKRFIDLVSNKLGNYIAQKSSSKEIIEEKERWRTIFHNVDDGIILLSEEGKVVEANLKAKDMLGIGKESKIDEPLFSLIEVLDPLTELPSITSIKNINKTKKTNQQLLEKKIDNFFRFRRTIKPQEYYIKTRKGRYWVVVNMKIAMENSQKEIYGIVHLKDITKNKDVEQDKNEFMSMVSHELRTPLSAMKGYLSMALNSDYGKLNKRQEKPLKRVAESNERMVALVEDILDVSRIDMGRINLKKQPINLSATTCAIVREFGAKIQEKKLKVIIQGRTADVCLKNIKKDSKHQCKDLHIYVLADQERLMQILQNLVSNAIKYSFDGGIINIDIKKDKEFAKISVSDHGVGVAREDCKKLFKRFSRIHNPLSVQAGGTGLGLYITKKLVQEHGGEITVRSQKEKGTTFSVKLPIAKQMPLI